MSYLYDNKINDVYDKTRNKITVKATKREYGCLKFTSKHKAE